MQGEAAKPCCSSAMLLQLKRLTKRKRKLQGRQPLLYYLKPPELPAEAV